MYIYLIMITLKIFLNVGFSINDVVVKWGMDKKVVRNLLKEKFRISDKSNNVTMNDNDVKLKEHVDEVFKQEFGESLEDWLAKNVTKDLKLEKTNLDEYKNYDNSQNFFHIEYDEKDTLMGIRVHQGIIISIENTTFSFKDDIQKVKKLLSKFSSQVVKTGNYRYEYDDLKIIIADENAMGGEENNTKLSLFCFSSK